MPDLGRDRCDGHHEVIDLKYQPTEKAPAIDGQGKFAEWQRV